MTVVSTMVGKNPLECHFSAIKLPKILCSAVEGVGQLSLMRASMNAIVLGRYLVNMN